MYVPHFLYLFACQWIFRVLSLLSYCEQCWNEHGYEDSFEIMFPVLLDKYPEVGLLGHDLYFKYFKETSYCFPQLNGSFLLFLSSSPLYSWTTFYISIHQLKDIWGLGDFRQLIIYNYKCCDICLKVCRSKITFILVFKNT